MASTKLIFGAIIAYILLGLYVYLVWCAVSVVMSTDPDAIKLGFTNLMSSSLVLIGGLVSALVIAELAITKPGEELIERAHTQNDSPVKKNFIRVVVYSYLAVWIIAGLVTFLISLRRPDALQPLTDMGQTWLGLAVAAAYAYLGIKPK
jgi:hypothetical protein